MAFSNFFLILELLPYIFSNILSSLILGLSGKTEIYRLKKLRAGAFSMRQKNSPLEWNKDIISFSDHSEWNCEKCEQKFPRRIVLINHMQELHAKEGFKCNLCKNTFTTFKHLLWHKERFHTTKELQCLVCLKLFPLPFHLRRHQRAFHFRETQFMCCKENFGSLKNLLSHEEQFHKGKRWRCAQCSKVCFSKNMLERHLKKPHGEKSKSSCPQCGLMMSPKALNCHITLVHKTDKVPCDECNDSFVSSKSLDKHKNIKHNGNIIIVKTSK